MLNRAPLVALLAAVLAAPLGPAPVAAAPAPVFAPAAAPAPTAQLETAVLRQQVDSALLGSGATVVAAAVDVVGVGALLRRGSTTALPPASTQKSFVALASLRRRGPDARPVTTVARSSGVSAAGNVPGSLFLVAGGDTTLTRAGLAQLARQVRGTGIRVVQGNLWLDDSRYDRATTAPGWKAGWLGTEIGPLSALSVDRNAYRRDAAFLRDPALHNAVLFREQLRAAGVIVRGTVRRGGRPASAPTVTARTGARLTDVLRSALETSDNFVAEMLVKELGRLFRGRGTTADGLVIVRQAMPGVSVGRMADGSGLSSLDRQSPAGQVQMLQLATRTPVLGHFVRALPVACLEGTLKRRMCGTAAAGRAVAKTGTLDGTRALAGFTRTADGSLVVFAFQLQGIPSGKRATDAMDRAVALLSGAR